MKKIFLLPFLFLFWLLPGMKLQAQKNRIDSLFDQKDPMAVIDSLLNGFDAFLDSASKPKSFFTAGTGIGNQTFSVKNNILNAQETRTNSISLTPAIGYFHKSGLGLSSTGYLTNINKQLLFYQFALTPSFDFVNDKIAAGISYTRYFGKDTNTLSSSPYENDFYGFFSIRHKKWHYGISAGYATGSFSDKLSYKDSIYRYFPLLQKWKWFKYTVTIDAVNKIQDLSVALTVRKDFTWTGVLHKKDDLSLSVSAWLVGGSSIIHSNANLNATKGKITLARFKKTYNTVDGNNFQIQSAAASLSMLYNIGKLSVQPVWFIDYYFPETEKQLSQVFSVMLGFTF